MQSLGVIKDFIQVVARAVADVLEIDTSVVDLNLVRIAGTVSVKIPHVINDGIIKKVLETRQFYMTHDTNSDKHCSTCSMRTVCCETAFVHCPIFFHGEIIGVMGLMCTNNVQREHLVAKSGAILNFLQRMCEIISLKLEEYENRENEKKLYKRLESHSLLLDQVLNAISDGYLIVDNQNRIIRANHSAELILDTASGEKNTGTLFHYLEEFDKNAKQKFPNGKFSFYDEMLIKQKNYGITISPIFNDDQQIGKSINFKTLDKIGSQAIYKAITTITEQDILGDSHIIHQLKKLMSKSSANNLNILIIGESGTGKELIARAIHNMSDRWKNPFIALNCAAIPETLLESELFGYEPGAFTGAGKAGKPGKFELAHTGTLFLDEIGDMPLFLQAKLLRVLQDFSIDRIGATSLRQVDVRIIAATNQNLESLVESGSFRRDLYYRLNVIPVKLPPLRERGNDIILLANHFLEKYTLLAGTKPKSFAPDAIQHMMEYTWPGNVRELENLIQYVSFIVTDDVISASALPEKFHSDASGRSARTQALPDTKEIKSMEDIKIAVILEAVARYGNTTEGKRQAAKELGIGKTTLYRKLAHYNKHQAPG